MKNFFKWVALLAITTVLAACGGGSDSDKGGGQPQGATVTGLVVNMDTDQPVEGATITAGGKSTLSAKNGSFTLGGLDAAAQLPVRVEALQFGSNVAFVSLPEKGTASVRVRLLPLKTPVTFASAAQAIILSDPDRAARVELPANSLVDSATGQPVVGAVKASITAVDPAGDAERMPGGYTTMSNGALRSIESFGAIKVDLRDANGRRLQLKPNMTATIRIPLSTRSPNPPATVPLYYFYEVTGRWLKEGEATLVTGSGESYYEGTVTHFSYWNADQEAETVEIEGCVQGANGAPAAGVTVSGSGVDYSGRSTAVTGADGRFKIQVRKNSTTGLWAATDTLITPIHEVEVGDTGGGISGDCMKLEASTSPIPGKLSPKVMLHPRNTTVAVGEAALLQVTAEGTQPMTYQWIRDGQVVANSNTPTLWIPNPGPSDNGATFTVKVSNAAGIVTSGTATLTVQGSALMPSIVMHPLPATVVAGENAAFAVSATGTGPLAYEWRRNGVAIAGANAATYSFKTVESDNGAQFSVKVSNEAGQVVSNAALLTVQPAGAPPVITQQPISQVVAVGGEAKFIVLAQGSGTLSYQWQRDGADIAGASGNSLSVAGAALADTGATFRVKVSNGNGSVTSESATLTVTAGTEAQQQQALRLMMLWSDGLSAAGAPLMLADDEFKVIAATTLCQTGGAVLKLDGAGTATGQQLPTGTHTLAVQFNECDQGFGEAYDGSSSLSYSFASADHRNGTAQATVNGMRHDSTDPLGDPTSVSVTGQAALALEGSVNGTQETVKLRFTPAANLTLTDLGDNAQAVFSSGNVLQHSVTTGTGAQVQPVLSRQEYSALRYVLGGVTYQLDGFAQFDFNGTGLPASTSGEVTLSANGQLIARIKPVTTGWAVEIVGAMPGLKAQGATTKLATVRRVGRSKALVPTLAQMPRRAR